MILPTTYAVALGLLILSMLCWGSWANTFKLARNWRFELYYFDYAFGVLLASVVAAFTFGSMGDGLSFLDNFSITGKRHIALAFVGGCIFNLANMLLVAAISLSGLAVAFPVGIGLALITGVILNFLIAPAGNPMLLFGGAAIVLVAIVVDAVAYGMHAASRGTAARGVSLKGLILSVVAGVLMGLFYPVVQLSMSTEFGLGPYAVMVVFAVGVVLSTLVLNLYFINLPVQGDPVPLGAYFRGSMRNHFLGLAGGVIWCTGALCNFVAANAPADVTAGPAVSYALGQGATMVSALWGLLVWKEFAGATAKVKMLLTVMVLLFLLGLGLVSVAPLYA